MRKETRGKTCSLLASSDLTVIAPIKPGLVPALDTVTYKARVKQVLRALHLGRTVSHELDLARVMSDAVERVGRIHSARVAVIEPQDVVLLAVTFDGSWESYVRAIWQKVARLLDLIFCNTVGHVPGATHSCEEWAAWIRRCQVEMPFAYATPGVTADDQQYFRMHERLALREMPTTAEREIIRTPIPSAEEMAQARSKGGTDPSNIGRSIPLAEAEFEPPAFRQGIRSLVGLYRLADWYPPGSEDGRFLLRAAQELLPEFSRQLDTDQAGTDRANRRPRVKEALDWFRNGLLLEQSSLRKQRQPPAKPVLFRPETVQAGILAPLEDCRHGVLAFLALPSAAAMASFLARVQPSVYGSKPPGDDIRINLALTVDGLRAAGLTEDEVALMPEEFVLGMARRAGLLGDVRINHPSRWRMPARNWNHGVQAPDLGDEAADRIEFDAVHVVLQLRLCNTDPNQQQARQTLWARLQGLVGQDCTPLSLQWMRRVRDPRTSQTVEHFGFGDGLSDPVFDADQAGQQFANHVHVGEALVGYGNSADEPPYPEDAGPPPGSFAELLHNGSYLVIRKLRQDLPVLDAAVEAATKTPGLDRDTVLAKMMGRWPVGHDLANQPLADLPVPGAINDFNYRSDPQGMTCPFHAHIRRANPRTVVDWPLQDALLAGRRAPRIFRRSLSYGEPFDRDGTSSSPGAGAEAERGLLFMAYNASIGEQFEVVQGWLAGGNSSGSISAPDPFVGVAEAGRKRHYRFEIDDKVVRVPVDGSDSLHDEPKPLVRLEWGVYAFAPSTVGLERLRQRAVEVAGNPQAAAAARMPWSLPAGRAAIEGLRRIEREQGDTAARLAWKAALEDVHESAEFRSASIWAAIRQDHGGALRTPYGVLIGSRDLVSRWMRESEHAVSVAGYMPRMRSSFGPIFLGMDAGPDYDREVKPALDGIAKLPNAFALARDCTLREIDRLAALAKEFAGSDEMLRRESQQPAIESVKWELTIDLRELVDHLLATFCEEWYGLSEEGGFLARGGFSWAWRYGDPARYPGHFMAPSRAFFQPHPGPEVEQTGSMHGQALAQSMGRFLDAFGQQIKPHKPAVREVLDSAVAQGDPTYAARTIIGMIMGFAPTVDGVLRRVLAQWGQDGTLWALRASRGPSGGAGPEPRTEQAFVQAMQLRTTPESLWRTATRDFRLQGPAGPNGVDVVSGDALVFGLMSATQQCLSEADLDVTLAFSGDRSSAQRPTHACPGRDLAMQMMQGFVHALVESTQPLRPGAAPTTFALEGRVDVPATPEERVAALLEAKTTQPKSAGDISGSALEWAKEPDKSAAVPFWAIGDSWLANLPLVDDLVSSLTRLGYQINDKKAGVKVGRADKGYRLASIATPGFLAKLTQDLTDAQQGMWGGLPAFILLGGGGNDLVEPKDRPKDTPLFGMLKPGATSADAAIDEDALGRFLAAMNGHYEKILDVLCLAAPGVPIFVHAYDYPIPDNRGFGRNPFTQQWIIDPWLGPVFHEARLDDLPVNIDVMRQLIKGLNTMVKQLAEAQQANGRKVHHLKLAGVLGSKADFGDPKADTGYRDYWRDELHPKSKGCDALAAAIADQLTKAGVGSGVS